MATGMALPGVLPRDSDFENVTDEDVRKVLRKIFDTETTINKVIIKCYWVFPGIKL